MKFSLKNGGIESEKVKQNVVEQPIVPQVNAVPNSNILEQQLNKTEEIVEQNIAQDKQPANSNVQYTPEQIEQIRQKMEQMEQEQRVLQQESETAILEIYLTEGKMFPPLEIELNKITDVLNELNKSIIEQTIFTINNIVINSLYIKYYTIR